MAAAIRIRDHISLYQGSCDMFQFHRVRNQRVANISSVIPTVAHPHLPSRILPIAKTARISNGRSRKLKSRAAEVALINEALEAEIAERKRAEAALRLREIRYHTLAQTAPVGIFHADIAGNVVDVNDAWCGIAGLRSEEAVNAKWLAGAHPEDSERIQKLWVEAADHALPFTCEFRFLRRDGSVKWVIGQAHAERNDAHEVIGYVGTITDTTDRKATEESLKRSAEETRRINDELAFYKFALDEAAIVVVTDSAGMISYVNDKFCQISGYQREELLTKNPRLLYSNCHPESFFTDMYAKIARGEVWRGEIYNRAKDGHFYWVDKTIIPTQDGAGGAVRYVGIGADITARKNVEAALETERLAVGVASLALAEKNKRLSELCLTAQRFMDDVSHEFRTPLSVIKGYSEIMYAGIAGPQTADQMRFSQIIIDRARDMAQMVDDLLDSSKLRAGSLRVDRARCDVAAIFAALHPIIDSRAAASNIHWIEEIEPGLPPIFADAEKATRVLVNLIVNAIKFSSEGAPILLSAKTDGDGDVRISVTDRGPGISPENLALIFERFRQVGNTLRNTKGFGLGLNIAKELVSLNFGSMNVTTELQKGSTFSFTLPVNQPHMILARLFQHLENLATPPGSFAVLRVTPQLQSGEKCVPPELRGYLACSSHPSDVILSTADGASLILFGYSSQPAEWHRRLVLVGQEIEQFTPSQKLRPFAVELIDTIPYPATLPDAVAILLPHLQMEAAHV